MGDTSQFAIFVDKLRVALSEYVWRNAFDYLANIAGVGVELAETTEQQLDGVVSVHIINGYFLAQRLLQMTTDGGLIRFSLPARKTLAAWALRC
jgi:NAD(P)-dependent dehydrogenase (short-subunit alcohol dehydrogenase family)